MIDFSPNTPKVLQWAAEDALKHHAELLVVYPYRLKNQNVNDQKAVVKKHLEQEAYHNFDQLKSSLPVLEQVKYSFSPEVGFETDRLEAHLQKHPISLMVLSHTIANVGDSHSEWDEFMSRMTIPVVLIP
jgi:hypothetical protein